MKNVDTGEKSPQFCMDRVTKSHHSGNENKNHGFLIETGFDIENVRTALRQRHFPETPCSLTKQIPKLNLGPYKEMDLVLIWSMVFYL